jgi:hypothetical protein
MKIMRKVYAMQSGLPYKMVKIINNSEDNLNIRFCCGIDDDQARRITIFGNDLTKSINKFFGV